MIYTKNKKVTLNGIEMSFLDYKDVTPNFFDYLEKFITYLERKLSKDDENFELSINLDFLTGESPKYKILSSGVTTNEIKEKVNGILEQTGDEENSRISGSVRINVQVEDQE